MADGGREPDFLTRHFGAVVTALVTLAGLAVGFFQFAVQQDRAEREWNLALSGFVLEHYEALFDEDDPLRRAHMRALMTATFPEHVIQAFDAAQQTQLSGVVETAETRDVLMRASDRLAELSFEQVTAAPVQRETVAVTPTAFLHIADEADRGEALALRSALAEAGFRAPGVERVEVRLSAADVRYFHREDEPRAARARALLAEAVAGRAPVRPEPVFLGDAYPNVPRGVIEVWIPPLGG